MVRLQDMVDSMASLGRLVELEAHVEVWIGDCRRALIIDQIGTVGQPNRFDPVEDPALLSWPRYLFLTSNTSRARVFGYVQHRMMYLPIRT